MFSTPFAYVVALVVLLCFFATAVITVTLRGGDLAAATPALSALLGLFGPTVGVLVLIIRQQHNIDEVQQVKKLVNGHLSVHMDEGTDATKGANGPAS